MRKQEIEEGLGELADVAERDHEVQMARADLYKLAKYAIKLHEMLKTVSEAEGIEGWQQAKITKAADYLGSVYHSLDYDMAHDGGQLGESKKDTHCSDKCCGAELKREDCKCPADCEHCNCNDPKVEEGKFKSDAHRKAVHAGKASGKKKKTSLRKESLQDRLASKLSESEQTCNECGKAMLTASEKKELADLEEGKRHGNSKIYKKCWKGCRKVAGVPRGAPGSCKCD